MKARARELGLTDAEVARRLGLSQSRYSAYVNGKREPDLATLRRICGVLRTTPDALLGMAEDQPTEDLVLSSAIAALKAMEPHRRELAASILRVMASHPAHPGGPGRARRTVTKKAASTRQRRTPTG